MKKLRGFPHTPGGNCWEGIQSYGEDSTCLDHGTPRGDCSECSRCAACDNMNLATSLSASEEATAIVEEPKKLYLPTASKTDHLFACTNAFGRMVRRETVGERTRFGSGFHEEMALRLAERRPKSKAIAKKWGIDVEELCERSDEAFPVISGWLCGDNIWGIAFRDLMIEQSVAWDVMAEKARFIENPDEETHTYLCEPDELPGTADIWALIEGKGGCISRQTKTLLILDHKSGWNVAQNWAPQTPAESGQLRSLALALATLHGLTDQDRIILAFFHARSGSEPLILADEITLAELRQHAKKLKAAWRNIGSGWTRQGEWCGTCPFFTGCGAQTSTLATLKAGGIMTTERIGEIHQTLAEYDRIAERLRDDMRAWIKARGPGQRPDGQLVDLVPKEVERLSKQSILDAYGKIKGYRLLEKLRRDGALTKKEQIELRAVRK
jgi:hypothetical protein